MKKAFASVLILTISNITPCSLAKKNDHKKLIFKKALWLTGALACTPIALEKIFTNTSYNQKLLGLLALIGTGISISKVLE